MIKKLEEQAKKLCFGKPSGNLFPRTKIYVPQPKFYVSPNTVHLADLCFYHTAKRGRKTFEYALNVVDEASASKKGGL